MTEQELELQSLESVGPATKQKLLDAGIHDVLELSVRSPSDLSTITGLELSKTTSLCNKARMQLVAAGRMEKDFTSAKDIYEKRKSMDRIATGCQSIDDLLAGGVETQAITEFYGEYGSGKSQICHTLAVTVQRPKEDGGLEGSAIYIDTEGTFRPERIYQIAEKKGLDPEEILSRITVAKAYNSSHQEYIIGALGGVIRDNDVRLVAVDSAVAHYRAEFLGRATLADRQQRLNRMMHLLLRTAENYNVAIVITNQIQSRPDTFFGDPFKPTGGHVVGHTSTYRIYLKKVGKRRIAKMVDSPCHPEIEAPYVLDEGGVSDLSEDNASRR